jgi:hypothetical protein
MHARTPRRYAAWGGASSQVRGAPTRVTVSRKPLVHPTEVPWTPSVVLSPRAGYRTMKKAGSAINRTMKQTKAAISILVPQCLATDRGFRRRGFLTYDTRASDPKFNRVNRLLLSLGAAAAQVSLGQLSNARCGEPCVEREPSM